MEIKKQIKGLIMILEQNRNINMITKSYVIEKLNMILGCGIGFHPSIKRRLENEHQP